MTLLSLNRNLKVKLIDELSTDVCYVLDEDHFRSALPLATEGTQECIWNLSYNMQKEGISHS